MTEEDLNEWGMARAYRLNHCITIVRVNKWEMNRAWNRYHGLQLAKRESSMSEERLLVLIFWFLLEKSRCLVSHRRTGLWNCCQRDEQVRWLSSCSRWWFGSGRWTLALVQNGRLFDGRLRERGGGNRCF